MFGPLYILHFILLNYLIFLITSLQEICFFRGSHGGSGWSSGSRHGSVSAGRNRGLTTTSPSKLQKTKNELKVKVWGDDQEVNSITYRKPNFDDDARVYWSSMVVKTDDDRRAMLKSHDMFRTCGPLELFVETK